MAKGKRKVMVVFGTRPEAIKMAPVIRALQGDPEFDVRVVVTAQHRQMLDQVLRLFDIEPHHDMNVMMQNQRLSDLTARILSGINDLVAAEKPDWLLVHGDTTTTMAAATAAFYARIPVGHIEAGLRTGNLEQPFPEEFNRRVAGLVTKVHFAPTETARRNLMKESVVDSQIEVTGNTVIDALLWVVNKIDRDSDLSHRLQAQTSYLESNKKLILVTGHRRENFGEGFRQVCSALRRIAERDDVQIVYPVHLNPNVKGPVYDALSSFKNVVLTEPLDYLPFVYLMRRAHLIVTDSGGVQEEAPSLGKPVLVMREVTERPEAVAAGTVKLVGAVADTIVPSVMDLLDNSKNYEIMSRAINPYGDGLASGRITRRLKDEK